VTLSLSSCSTLWPFSGGATNDVSTTLRPYASKPSGSGASSEPLMLDGYDPVAYHALRELRRGSPQYSENFDGVVYRFASDAHRQRFQQTPRRYVPAFGGHCANQMRFGLPVRGDPTQWKVIDGQLFLFSSSDARNYFLMFEVPNRALAAQLWADEVRGRSATWQRMWRTVFRVPHYQTPEQQEAIWQQSRAGGGVRPVQPTPN
jgi:YHS domain-containing protein